MFNFIKQSLSSIYHNVTSKLNSLFSRSSIDSQTLEELKKLLIESDVGIQTTDTIMNQLTTDCKNNVVSDGTSLRTALHTLLLNALTKQPREIQPQVFLLVGVNGTGKTTCAAKLAHLYKQSGKKVLLVAADTFRAAAVEQLTEWANKLSIDIIHGTENQDPASVVFKGTEEFKNKQYDLLIIDTAGRLQTKQNLMNELTKIKKVLTKSIPSERVCTILSVDAMLGQNSLQQAKLFHESTHIDGVILTKMDGTGKGGIIFAINQELGLPVLFISFGEQIDQIKQFNAAHYVQDLLSK